MPVRQASQTVRHEQQTVIDLLPISGSIIPLHTESMKDMLKLKLVKSLSLHLYLSLQSCTLWP